MNLSLSKKLGWTHVVGGRLFEVETPHAVGTGTLSHFVQGPETDYLRDKSRPIKPRPDGKWVYCDKGDIAIEILYAKSRMLVGYSYLSGPAINLNRYTDKPSEWFGKELSATLVDFPTHPDSIDDLIKITSGIRFGPHAVGVFKMNTGTYENSVTAGEVLAKVWGFVPKAMTDEEVAKGRAHLMGLFEAEKGGTSIHFQPPCHRSDYQVTEFQICLVLSSLGAWP